MKNFCIVLKSGAKRVIAIEEIEEERLHKFITTAMPDDEEFLSTNLRPGWFAIRFTEIAMIIAM